MEFLRFLIKYIKPNLFTYFINLRKENIYKKDTLDCYSVYVLYCEINKVKKFKFITFSEIVNTIFGTKSKTYHVGMFDGKQIVGRRYE